VVPAEQLQRILPVPRVRPRLPRAPSRRPGRALPPIVRHGFLRRGPEGWTLSQRSRRKPDRGQRACRPLTPPRRRLLLVGSGLVLLRKGRLHVRRSVLFSCVMVALLQVGCSKGSTTPSTAPTVSIVDGVTGAAVGAPIMGNPGDAVTVDRSGYLRP